METKAPLETSAVDVRNDPFLRALEGPQAALPPLPQIDILPEGDGTCYKGPLPRITLDKLVKDVRRLVVTPGFSVIRMIGGKTWCVDVRKDCGKAAKFCRVQSVRNFEIARFARVRMYLAAITAELVQTYATHAPGTLIEGERIQTVNVGSTPTHPWTNKIELVDAATGKVIGPLDSIKVHFYVRVTTDKCVRLIDVCAISPTPLIAMTENAQSIAESKSGDVDYKELAVAARRLLLENPRDRQLIQAMGPAFVDHLRTMYRKQVRNKKRKARRKKARSTMTQTPTAALE